MTVSIDKLAPQKSHIDLNDPNLPTDFGMDDYILSRKVVTTQTYIFGGLNIEK